MRRSLICFVVALTAGFVGPPATAGVYQYHPASTLYLGGGFDPERPERAFPPCVEFKGKRRIDSLEETDLKTARGYETRFTLSLVRSKRELYQHLQVDTKLSASYGIFSASGSFSLEEELGLNTDDVVWILKGSTDYGRFAMSDPQLNAFGLAARDAGKFPESCGSEFVSQERRVAMAAAVFVAHTSNEFQKKRLEASFQAGASWGLGTSANISANYASFYKFAAEASTVTVNLFSLGGSGVTKLADLTAAGGDLPKVQKVIQDYLATLTVQDSAAVEYVSGSFRSFGVDLQTPQLAAKEYTLSEIYFAFNDFSLRHSRLAAYLRAPDQYSAVPADLSSYTAALVDTRDRLSVLYAYAARCTRREAGDWSALPTAAVCATNGCPEPAAGECILPVLTPPPPIQIPASHTLQLQAELNDGAFEVRAVAPDIKTIAVYAPHEFAVSQSHFVAQQRILGGAFELVETDFKGAPLDKGQVVGLAIRIPEEMLEQALRENWIVKATRGERKLPIVEDTSIRLLLTKRE